MQAESVVHCYPFADLIEHETDGTDCICGVTTEFVISCNGTVGLLVVHHSLDGREQHEIRNEG